MPIWFDENNTRRGVLSADDFQEAISNAGAITLFLAANPASTAAEVAAGVAGMTQRRAGLLLDRLVTAGLATESEGDYSSVLVESGG